MYQASRLGFGKPKGEGGEKDQGGVIAQTNKVSIDGGWPQQNWRHATFCSNRAGGL